MKKTYIIPEAKISSFDDESVVTTSAVRYSSEDAAITAMQSAGGRQMINFETLKFTF